jgi:hypothetical protein
MSEPDAMLPHGVQLARRGGQESIELTIRAADANELAWRIHDLIPLIQSGRLAKIIAQTEKEQATRHK